MQLFKSTAKGKHSWEGTLEAAEREHRLYIPKENLLGPNRSLLGSAPVLSSDFIQISATTSLYKDPTQKLVETTSHDLLG